VSFEKDVLPVLKAKCFRCHDQKKQTADLRLDVRSRAFAGGESGKKAIVPGKPYESELLNRVTTANDERVMPPSGDRLTDAQIGKLKAWIAAGAKWPDALANEATGTHWAFVPPKRPTVPAGGHPIDAFVLARLQKEGLKPSPEADKVTLCRRLYLDLIGLPPTPKQVDEFLADTSPDAYGKLVETLLASPHYGEKWARPWLDAARYADSDGFEKDKPRQVWFYRDWVVAALNRDLPFDRFVIEQIAGDLLPNATQDQRVATGYLRNSMINEEGGIDPEQFRMEAMFDRIDAVGKGVLGLTVQCAQCHTHKFDPISHAEYYRLFAYLNNAHEATAAVYTPADQAKRAELFRKVKEVEDELRHKAPDWRARMHAWEETVRDDQPDWTVAKPTNLDGSGGQKNYLLPDGSVLAAGYSPSKETSVYTFAVDGTVTALRLELLTDPSLPRGGPGRSANAGLFALTEVTVTATGPWGKAAPVKVASATADADPPERPLEAHFADKTTRKRVVGPVKFAVDGKDETAWTIDIGPGRSNVPRKAVFVFEKPVTFPKGGTLTVKLVQNHGGWNSNDNQSNNLGRFRFSLTDAEAPTADPLPAAVREIVSKGRENRTPAEELVVFGHWRTTVADWKAANDAIDGLWKEHPVGATQLVLQERAEPRPTHVLKRGDFLKPAEAVAPGVPAVLHPFPADAPADRLGFARWLVDRNSPTTARAFVNRVWQAYFGAGLVGTPEDFGTQGDLPTHPELLDWLAVEFMEPTRTPTDDRPWALTPWSVKHLHRVIVTSATYKQSSKVTPELAKRDPANKHLARGPRFRADAEVVRDVALAAGGLLTPTVGGPSVYPPVPEFLMLPPASYGEKTWPVATGPDRYRRSLYVFRFRSVPYPVLAALDAPNGDFACVRRTRSNTPLAALTGLNEPVFVEAARGLAAVALADGGPTDADKLTHAFRRCVARKPTGKELAVLTELLGKQRDRFAGTGAWSALRLTGGDKFPAGVAPAEAAAWVAVARVLLNLDETMTKE
jgi:cytochrome c553